MQSNPVRPDCPGVEGCPPHTFTVNMTMSDWNDDSPWIISYSQNNHSRLPLICIPYAGGGASIFATWSQMLPTGIDVLGVQPPGRENRIREPPCRRIEHLVEPLTEVLAGRIRGPYALFGYSVGALVALETGRLLSKSGKAPAALMVASCLPPHAVPSLPPITHLEDDAFLAALNGRFGGFSPEFLGNDELRAAFLPTLKADLELIESYSHDADGVLTCPLLAAAGVEDRILPQPLLVEWERYTTGPFRARLYPGGHFFIREYRHRLLAQVADSLAKYL
jgi:medium-chain acyl-[acyl-carrier-protein] hydrolase